MKLTSEDLKNYPTAPGCYIFKDKGGKVLYVGKAKNIRVRLNTYFSKQGDGRLKIDSMLQKAKRIETIVVDSETEALILESNLIKKYRPKYNTILKDDKNYIWVMFEKNVDFPRPRIVREKKVEKADYFGPFPKSFPAKQVLHELRHMFPYCNTNFSVKNGKGAEARPCLDYYVGLCSGVCAGKILRTEHKRNISHIKKFFRGEKQKLYEEFSKSMKLAAGDKDFEKAALFRDKLENLTYITQGIKVKEDLTAKELQDTKFRYLKAAEAELIQKLHLDVKENKKGFRIECYDISNTQGTNATGSMVVFVDAQPAKDQYRKFKIKTKSTPDDFFMMQEVLTRRIKRFLKADKKFSPLPDLIIVDGGKGQLSSAYEILKQFQLEDKISLAGLAKREEELFQVVDTEDEIKFSKTTLPRRSRSLYLVQRIRDEAHRFAIGFHRKLRSKSSIKSVLADIPGVGDLTQKKLFKAFGSLDAIKKASPEALQTVVRNKKTVEAIKKLL